MQTIAEQTNVDNEAIRAVVRPDEGAPLPLEPDPTVELAIRRIDAEAAPYTHGLAPAERPRFLDLYLSGTTMDNPLMAELTYLRLLLEEAMALPTVRRIQRAPNGEAERRVRVWLHAALDTPGVQGPEAALRQAYDALPEADRSAWREELATLLTRRLGEYREELRRERDEQRVRDPERISKLVNAIGYLESVRIRLCAQYRIQNEGEIVRIQEEDRQLATLLREKLADNLALLWEIACEYNYRLGRPTLTYIKEHLEAEARLLGQLGPDEYFPAVEELVPPLSHGREDTDGIC